ENLKLITGERVLDDKPESHSGSMSSLKNLDDSVNFGDQFLHDKPTEDDQEKSKTREESGSTIPDPKFYINKHSESSDREAVRSQMRILSVISVKRSLLHDNIVPKPDLALELGKSISLTEAEEEAVAREVHATHARIVSESEPEPTQRRQSGIAFKDSFIVSKKRSSDSSKKLKVLSIILYIPRLQKSLGAPGAVG
ncbi:hypothetical protein Tco_1573473, partial [Tanacetum coccineum]